MGFPQDQIFCPTIADPKEARSFVSLLRGTFRSLDDPSGKDTTIVSVGLGDSFGRSAWGWSAAERRSAARRGRQHLRSVRPRRSFQPA